MHHIMNTAYRRAAVVLCCTALAATALSQEDPNIDPYKEAAKKVSQQWAGTRGTNPLSAKKLLADQGLSKYLRASKQDGNLIETGYVNQGSLATDYFPGASSMIWPKGSGTSYGHTFVFYAGALVVDTRGDTIPIVTNCYRRGEAEQSPDKSHWYHWRPLPKYFNNHHTASADWDMGGINEDVGADGLPNTHDEGEGDGKLQAAEDFNGNGVLDVSMINVSEYSAMSHLRETWPAWWPVGSYVGDSRTSPGPGTRDGKWNGAYGAYARADQESYYVMDDRENDEYQYYPFDDSASHLPWPYGRRGLGLSIDVRSYQWSAHLAEDIMISIFDIVNWAKPLTRGIVGMYCDPDMGGSLSGDNASFDTKDDITYAWSDGDVSNLGLPLGYFGFAFLESPSLSDDGIDNDEDGLTDESQWNALDEDGDWKRFTDVDGDGTWDAGEPLNDDLGSDGLGPEMEEYSGPDPDGTQGNGIPDQGEPNFGKTDNDESDQVGLTSFYLRDVANIIQVDKLFWDTQIQPGTYVTMPGYTRDISWTYGSGFVKMMPGITGSVRYAIALLFGVNRDDIFRNKRTMQEIYNHDYNFSKPPRKPLVAASTTTNKVILTWDDAAERSIDPIYGPDFEAYMVYRSTEPTFSEIKTVSDAFGNAVLFKPIAIYDLVDGLKGPHPIRLGSEYGPESDLGVAMNMGTDSGLRHHFIDTSVTNGRTYYYAVVSLDKGYATDFYDRGISPSPGLLPVSPTECSATIQTDPIGRVTFSDRNTAVVVPSEVPAGYLQPQVQGDTIQHVSGAATGPVKVEFVSPYITKPGSTYELWFTDDSTLTTTSANFTGYTNKIFMKNVTLGGLPQVIADPADVIFEGFKMHLQMVEKTSVKSTGWISGSSNLQAVAQDGYSGIPVPRDYEIRVMDMSADSSTTRLPLNFQIWDVTYPAKQIKIKCLFLEPGSTPFDQRGRLTNGDQILMVSERNRRLWVFRFAADTSVVAVDPVKGDVFKIVTNKPYERNDLFQFTVTGNAISQTRVSDELSKIYTVPDPYVAVSTLERKLVSTELGRGDRRVDFVNLPPTCTITIFTSSGRIVRRLNHQATANEGREPWDLRTEDGLEVSHGVYVYAVETPSGAKKIGKMAIIK